MVCFSHCFKNCTQTDFCVSWGCPWATFTIMIVQWIDTVVYSIFLLCPCIHRLLDASLPALILMFSLKHRNSFIVFHLTIVFKRVTLLHIHRLKSLWFKVSGFSGMVKQCVYPQGTAAMLTWTKYKFTSPTNNYCKVRRNSKVTKLLLSVRVNYFVFLKEMAFFKKANVWYLRWNNSTYPCGTHRILSEWLEAYG